MGVSYLALKVATKWQSWTNIVRLADGDQPQDDIPRLRRLRARSYASSWLTTRFLVGTLGNLLAGFVGYGAYWGAAKVLNALC